LVGLAGKHVLTAVAVVLALLLLPSLAAAEPFTLPSKAVYLESWEYWAACVEPSVCRYHNYGVAYSPDAYLVYRVLINPDGSRQILDIAPVNDDVHNYYPVYYHSLSAPVPEKQIDLTEPGSYRVELRKIEVPRPTATHAASFTPDSVVDWWVAEQLGRNPVPGAVCSAAWDDNCWVEKKTDSNIKLSDRSVLLEYYEITVAAPIVLPDGPDNNIDRSSMNTISVSSPFEQNKGIAQSDNDKATAGMALAGILTVAAVGAGAYLYRSYTTSSGSSFNAYQTAAGKANDAAVLAEKQKIIRMDEEYAEKMRQYNLKKAQEKAIATALARLAAAGPTAMMTASPATFVPKEETVGTGAFNFLDAPKLKDEYGYTISDALGIAYSKNPVVRTIMGFSTKVEETQAARMEDAEKYPQPLESIVKFSASFASETTGAISNLLANGFFGAGSLLVIGADTAFHPEDAEENFAAVGGLVMGSLLRWGESMRTMTLHEDPAITLGAITSYVIAPEDALISKGGKLSRAARIAKDAKAAERGAGEVGAGFGKTFIEVSEINTEEK
jgi:hypothetical protein